ncbi:DUF2339 domain-containing protein, partial [Candidatus Woesebacteria bacterium]|nr:DUF2339 domain-containing protein [Candidatus Woesebacteria bacterium]
ATVLVTIFAAREIYEMFSPLTALIIVNIAAIAIALSSLKNKLQSRAVVGLTAALIVPLFVATPTPNYLGLLSYLTAITIGYVWLIWLKGWRIALAALLAGILFYLVPIIGSGVIKHDPALNMLVLQFSIFFTLLLFSANLAVLMKRRASDTWNILIGALLGIFSLAWIYQLVPDYLRGLTAVALSIVFMAGSFAVSKISHTKNAVIVYAAVSVSLIGAAITFELSGSAMAISFILLATSVVVTSTLLDRNNAELRPIGLLFLVPGFLSVACMDQSLWTKHIPLSDFAVLSVMTISLLLVASIFRQWIFTTEKPAALKWISSYDIAGLAYGMITIWLINQSLFVDSTGNAISLIIFTILGLGFYIAGKIRQGKIMRTTGVVVLVLVTARLLLVEVWNMPITGRIITFAFIGVLFMFTTLFERGIMKRWEKK